MAGVSISAVDAQSEPSGPPRRWWHEPGPRWIGLVIALLVGNAGMLGWLILQAGPASARRVLPDYYQRAAAYDQQIAQRRANHALGWRVELAANASAWQAAVGAPSGPITDAAVTLRIRHRTDASLDREVRLAPTSVAGRYALDLVVPPGLYDVAVVVDRGQQHFELDQVVERTP